MAAAAAVAAKGVRVQRLQGYLADKKTPPARTLLLLLLLLWRRKGFIIIIIINFLFITLTCKP